MDILRGHPGLFGVMVSPQDLVEATERAICQSQVDSSDKMTQEKATLSLLRGDTPNGRLNAYNCWKYAKGPEEGQVTVIPLTAQSMTSLRQTRHCTSYRMC